MQRTDRGNWGLQQRLGESGGGASGARAWSSLPLPHHKLPQALHSSAHPPAISQAAAISSRGTALAPLAPPRLRSAPRTPPAPRAYDGGGRRWRRPGCASLHPCSRRRSCPLASQSTDSPAAPPGSLCCSCRTSSHALGCSLDLRARWLQPQQRRRSRSNRRLLGRHPLGSAAPGRPRPTATTAPRCRWQPARRVPAPPLCPGGWAQQGALQTRRTPPAVPRGAWPPGLQREAGAARAGTPLAHSSPACTSRPTSRLAAPAVAAAGVAARTPPWRALALRSSSHGGSRHQRRAAAARIESRS